jgi:hypothetical protein
MANSSNRAIVRWHIGICGVIREDSCYLAAMVDSSYRVVPRGDSGFDVEMDRPDGRRKTVPGFRSEHEANAWIVQAKRMIRDAGPWTRLAPRKPASEAGSEAPNAPSSLQIEPEKVADSHGSAAPRRSRIRPARQR